MNVFGAVNSKSVTTSRFFVRKGSNFSHEAQNKMVGSHARGRVINRVAESSNRQISQPSKFIFQLLPKSNNIDVCRRAS